MVNIAILNLIMEDMIEGTIVNMKSRHSEFGGVVEMGG
jgi:hypothetical protein